MLERLMVLFCAVLGGTAVALVAAYSVGTTWPGIAVVFLGGAVLTYVAGWALDRFKP